MSDLVTVEIDDMASMRRSLTTDNPREAGLWIMRMMVDPSQPLFANLNPVTPLRRVNFYTHSTGSAPQREVERLLRYWQETLR